jgi:ubiquinone/menaquinone biosynthesis C-methylase UbiE
MRGNTVKSFYETFNLENAINRPSPALKRFLEAEIDFIKKHLDCNHSVLEIGCGFGRVLEIISGKARAVTGIDFSDTLLKQAKEKLAKKDNIDLHNMEAHRLKFDDCTFRCTMCMENTFGNMPEIALDVLKEMKRVTKKGGQIILSVYSEAAKDMQLENYNLVKLTNITESANAIQTDEGLYSRRFTKDELKELFRSIGLECEITQLCPENYIAIAEK